MIKLRKEERRPIGILMMMFFCIVGSSITGASARDTFFLTQFDKSLLPLMFSLVAGLMVVVIYIYNKIASTLDLIQVIRSSSIFFCITLFLIRINLSGVVIPIFYAWVDVIISITIFQFWLLAGEIFNPRQAKRLFSLIGIGGSIAGISAGYLMRPFVNTYGAKELIIPTIIMIALLPIFAQILNKHRTTKPAKKSNENDFSSTKEILDPYLKSILVMVCATAICSRIIEYQFKITAANSFQSSEQLASFFGDYYMYLNGTTLIMQLFLTGFILQKFGILGGLIIMPLGLIIGSASFLVFANLSSIFIARLFDQSFKFSVQSASNEMLWTPIPKSRARKAKPIIDSSFKSIAEGTIGLIIYIFVALEFLNDDQIFLLSIPAVLIIVVWLGNNLRIRKKYVSAVEKAINHRQLNLNEIQFDITDSQIITTIKEALENKNIHQQMFALDLIKNMNLQKWTGKLNSMLKSEDDEIKKQILLLAYEKNNFIEEDLLLNLSKQDDQIGAIAVSLFDKSTITKNLNELSDQLFSTSPHKIASTAVAILKHDPEHIKAKVILNNFLDIKDESTTAIALDYLKNSTSLLPEKTLIDLLNHTSIEISKSALNVAGNRLKTKYIPAIISNLENIKCAQNARKVLRLYNQELVLPKLINQLKDLRSNDKLKIGIIRCMTEYNQAIVIDIYKEFLKVENLVISSAISESLLKIAKKKEYEYDYERNFYNHIKEFTNQYFRFYCFEKLAESGQDSELIIDQINFEKRKLLYIILKLVTLTIPNSPIDSHIKSLINKEDKDLPYILEFFDSSFSRESRKLLMPIVDPENDYKKEDVKEEQEKYTFESWLKNWVISNNNWKAAISIDYLMKNNVELLNEIEWDNVANSPILGQIFKNFPNKKTIVPLKKYTNQLEQTMFTVLEKTLLLKTVDLFQEIPGELLSQVSKISKARPYEKNSTIFNEGDAGDSMFIVFEGIVSIKKGSKEIAELKKGASLGEMALLDNETRSADAIAKEDSVLLKINQDVFYELMESNADIMKQIIKLLTARIRKANVKLETNLK